MLCFHCRKMVATFFLRELIAPSEMQSGTPRCDVTLARNACLFVAKCFLRPLSFLGMTKKIFCRDCCQGEIAVLYKCFSTLPPSPIIQFSETP